MKIFVLCALLGAAIASPDADLTEFKSGNHLLTSDIYKELLKQFNGNFLVSPFSIETILALTLSGARGQTAQEIATSLRLPKQAEEILTNLLPQLRNDQYTLLSANKIYVKEKFPINDDFKKLAVDKYEADLQNIDFDKKQEAAREINEWVEAQTKNKIHDIVSPKDITEDSRLILINALYFQGNWSTPFKPISTLPKKFYPKEKEVVEVDTMHVTQDYNYYECTEVDAKFLELPFKGGEASMIVVLPNDKSGILNLESKIDKVFTPRDFKKETVEVALPKFKVESSIDFVDILKTLGIKKAFNESEADLSGISGKKGELVVSAVRQKAFIDVQEGGVEAAAATVVHIPTVISARPVGPPLTPKTFIADHPFIYYIKIKGVVLFGGRVILPKPNP